MAKFIKVMREFDGVPYEIYDSPDFNRHIPLVTTIINDVFAQTGSYPIVGDIISIERDHYYKVIERSFGYDTETYGEGVLEIAFVIDEI